LPSEQPNVPSLEERILALLKHVGEPGRCRGCGLAIYWVRHPDSGRNAPYDPDGVNHFITCPRADDFRKKKALAKRAAPA
jgi:hypothetical protein